MQGKQSKVIIDTNLWISYLISKDYQWLDKLIFGKHIHLIFSQELLDEFINVVNRPKLRKYFSNEDLARLLEIIDLYCVFVKTTSKVNICRDLKDNFLLALSKDSKADYLLTGDLDLLELKKFEKTKITRIKDFKDSF